MLARGVRVAAKRVLAGGVAALALSAPGAASAQTLRAGDVYARVSGSEVVLGNRQVERRWSRAAFRTTLLRDKRRSGRRWGSPHRDFSLSLGGTDLGSDAFRARSVRVDRLARGGLRVTMSLVIGPGAPGGLEAVRTAEAYPGVAGFRTQTTLRSAAPLALAGATLDEAALGRAAPAIHAFRAGADWRQPGYRGPNLSIGDAHGGTWRASRRAAAGARLEGAAQWLSAASGRRTLFMVMERNDFPSSRAAYDGRVASLRLRYGQDVVILGPLEEQAHVENPTALGQGRRRTIGPGAPLRLEAAFTGFSDHPGDEPWQFYKYLVGHRLQPYDKAVTFNSNGVDEDRISTGAKDDVDLRTVRQLAPIARRLGVETFILDDGWQARSGDWQPDSPAYREPRRHLAPRFPDPQFRAVRSALGRMRLGLWMSPMHFHPSSSAWRRHPDWVCQPVGSGLLAYNQAEPYDSSNEAGIVPWGPRAIPYIESRIREGIVRWGVRYWKFDFLAWLDCAGQGDVYAMHDAFVAMLDRLRRDHPQVTFQIDETNDYRMFPFESVSRGPSWFQNGSPPPEHLLHNLWNLSPFVPGFSVGQHVLGGQHWKRHPVATLMAAALPSHITFFTDLRELPRAVLRQAAPWLRFYKRNRHLLAQMTYPLLRDPVAKGWTALQAWNPERPAGALLAFRQESRASRQRIALRNVPPRRRFDLFSGPSTRYAGTVTSSRLTRGLTVRLSRRRTARVLLIVPARRPRLRLRARCSRGRVRARVDGRDRRRVRRVAFYLGRRLMARDGRAPFVRTLRRSRSRRLAARVRMRDGRLVRLRRRAPRCVRRAARRPARRAPRFTG